ncbi:unnamed protein product [Closterium sp. Yama58-4]|nr:unnamed protein product [Closterium sp. Yama58-4]
MAGLVSQQLLTLPCSGQAVHPLRKGSASSSFPRIALLKPSRSRFCSVKSVRPSVRAEASPQSQPGPVAAASASAAAPAAEEHAQTRSSTTSNSSSSSSTGSRTAAGEDNFPAASIAETLQLTGGSLGFAGATSPLVPAVPGQRKQARQEKRIVLIRHGLSSWNAEGRVQGRSDESVLSETGEIQALRCREALRDTHFDCCYSSPISRAKSSAEIIWEGRKEPLVFLDSLSEAHLHFLEGMLNSEAKRLYPDLFRAWREDPADFCVDGVFPVHQLWEQARDTWRELLESPGSQILVVTHKSLLRALLCTALGLGPDKFRAVDINNGGMCVVMVNNRGEPMLLLFALLTVSLGVANRVLYKLALITLHRYPFFLAQLTTFGYVAVYSIILLARTSLKIVTPDMLSLPKRPFMFMGLLEAAGLATGMMAAAHMPGVLIPVLSQIFLVWQLTLSSIFLGRRYSPQQLLGCFLVIVGVAVVVVTSGPPLHHVSTLLSSLLTATAIQWPLLFIVSTVFPAASSIIKVRLFPHAIVCCILVISFSASSNSNPVAPPLYRIHCVPSSILYS